MKTIAIYAAHGKMEPLYLTVANMKAAVKLARGIMRQRGISEVDVDRQFASKGRVEFLTKPEANDWIEIIIRNPSLAA